MGAGGRVSRCISAGTAGRCAALLGDKSAGGTAGGGTGGDRRPVGFGGADTGKSVRSAAGLESPVRDTLLSPDGGLCDLWDFGSQRCVFTES